MDLKWVHMAESIIVEAKEIQSRIIQLEAENEELRRENKRMGEVIKPQPCTRFRDAGTVEWIAKLMEETNEAIQEAYIISQHEQSNKEFPCEAMNEVIQDARVRLAMELTDVKTLCESWLYAEGWNEEEREELQRLVNEKNRERGYF